MIISLIMIVLGLALLLAARRTADAERFTWASWLVLVGMATMVVFVALISVIGFEIPAALLAFVWLRFLGHESAFLDHHQPRRGGRVLPHLRGGPLGPHPAPVLRRV